MAGCSEDIFIDRRSTQNILRQVSGKPMLIFVYLCESALYLETISSLGAESREKVLRRRAAGDETRLFTWRP
jgi:hypothetical protein